MLILLISILLISGNIAAQDTSDEIYAKQKEDSWFKDGVNLIKENLKQKTINKKAKSVILFVGDGMGLSTVTASRILDGQLKGQTGEENVLSWEHFPNVGLSKTYNTDAQTGDSAGTATAFMTGVKAAYGVVSVNEKVSRRNCTISKDNKVLSILMLAELAGLSTGVITTARLTHATPSCAYSHSADRNWECDTDIKGHNCKDIAQQFIDFPYGDGLEVAFGGGRKNFMPNTVADPEYPKLFGKRQDGRNLINEWTKKTSAESKYEYVWNERQFKQLNPAKVNHVLGLFEPDHMHYAYERINDTAGEPCLTEMVDFAVKVLEKNPKGYFLLVEAGRIDHGHHDSKAFQALHDTVELNNAVKKAAKVTKAEENLLIVTADHSHVCTIGGYQKRGNPIFGYTNMGYFVAKDGKRFTSLGYYNGPGSAILKARKQPDKNNLKNPNFSWQGLVPLDSETHGAEDVGIYARGPQSHLIRGVVEQNYIFHVMDYALCLSESKKEICKSEGLFPSRTTNRTINGTAKTTIKCTSDSVRYNGCTILPIFTVSFLYKMFV